MAAHRGGCFQVVASRVRDYCVMVIDCSRSVYYWRFCFDDLTMFMVECLWVQIKRLTFLSNFG